MTLQEFYDRIGGDYKATISRLPSEALIKKFVLKYPGDPSFSQLKDAGRSGLGSWPSAPATLKGVAQNLAWTACIRPPPLCDAAAPEAAGGCQPPGRRWWPRMREVLAAIREL